jgi:phosphoglycerol transferase MdoB-like AlkP superfamily enzyme
MDETRQGLASLARVANAIFFLLTSTYCLLTYSSFAYQQFVRPHLVAWLSGFVVWHHFAFWLALFVTAFTMVPELKSGRGRRLGWGYLAASAAVGVVLLVRPVLPQVENNWTGLAFALVALVFPIWLAVFDHVRCRPSLPAAPSSERRLAAAALLACGVVWAAQVVVVPFRLSQTGEIPLAPFAVVFGVLMSAIVHLLVFGTFALVTLAVLRLGRFSRSRGEAEYWLLAILAASAVAVVINRQMFAAIAFTGRAAWTLSVELALMLTLVWSGIARRLHGDGTAASTMDLWLSPLPGIRFRQVSAMALIALVFVEIGLIAYVMTFDWDFVLQKLCVVAVWFLAFGYSYGALSAGNRSLGWPSIAAPAMAGAAAFAGSLLVQPRVPAWIGDPRFVPEFVLEGYVAVDPSYRLIHDAVRFESRPDAEFYAHLRANSTIQHVEVSPIPVDFERPIRTGAADKPNIFLFVIDSLRRDYLSPYNKAVGFTPAIGEFAKESVVFERAFTRYGGTGLSVPAIFAGGLLLHKQYVTPFDSMNALLKMLEADGYRRLMSMDSVVAQLMAPPPPGDELDRGVHIMSYRLCTTLQDLQTKLGEHRGDRPVFAYSLPQDLHISHIRGRPMADDASYSGFFPQVAAQVQEMDGCFGQFVSFLKERGLYDDSVIVLTSDHGDSLGEGMRYGHSYTMFPEVARIPLIVHLPKRFQGLSVDPGAVSLSTDLTPTFYLLAGHDPADLGPLYGRPLLARHAASLPARRNDPQLLASSYGAVYAVLRDNASRLYIADGVNNRDYAYELKGDSSVRIGITAAERRENRRFIREQVDAIARAYERK